MFTYSSAPLAVSPESTEKSLIFLFFLAALLTVVPNQSQFFQHESVTLKCQPLGNLLDWKVMRNTSKHTNKECLSSGNSTDKSSCFLDYLIPSDSGVYWCESGPGFYSNTINISVTGKTNTSEEEGAQICICKVPAMASSGGHVIVEVPVFPVVEGANVTLFCKGRDSPSLYSSNSLTGTFYKDGALVESSSAGILTIHNISKSDEGHYSCASGKDTSPESWLTVTGWFIFQNFQISDPSTEGSEIWKLVKT